MENQPEKEPKSLVAWLEGSLFIKLITIAFITLLLLIPTSLVQDLIRERQSRQREAVAEVSKKWSSAQVVNGPVLVIPYKIKEKSIDEKGREGMEELLSNVYLLPEELDIRAETKPEVLHRGIFEVVVYHATIKVKGNFGSLDFKKSAIQEGNLLWDKAHLVIGMSDLKGLKNNPEIIFGKEKYPVEMDFFNSTLFENNLIILPELTVDKNTAQEFSYELDLRGSEALHFLPLGRNTKVQVVGRWTEPSFDGEYLPENREITKDAFSASWEIPVFNRNYPQQWVEQNAVLSTQGIAAGEVRNLTDNKDKSFGVKFLLPVDAYQKNMRTAKYGILIILLTFVSLYFTELIIKRKISLIHYVLIGAAMVVYYTLLLSFSEQVGFDGAYLIASLATIILISSFLWSILKDRKAALLLSLILTVFYVFIYVIMQLQDLSLLMGSIALFLIVAILMYFSNKINWNKPQV